MLSDGVRPQPAADALHRAAELDGAMAFSSGDRWWRVWACPEHLDRLTGLRESGLQGERPAPGSLIVLPAKCP
jgi:hypothetical protein